MRRGILLRLPLPRPTVVNGTSVACLIYGIIVLEIGLSAGLLLPRSLRRPLLIAGIAMHVGIILMHGLVTFGLTMIMALLLLLGDTGRGFSFSWRSRMRQAVRRAAPPLAEARAEVAA